MTDFERYDKARLLEFRTRCFALYLSDLSIEELLPVCNRIFFYKWQYMENGETYENSYIFLNVDRYLEEYSSYKYHECERIINNRYSKKKRVQKRIEYMLNKYKTPIYATFTFREDVFKTTEEETRRVYVRRFLKENCDDFLANIDYGEKKGREHYHAVLGNRVDPTKWKYGALNVRPINKNSDRLSSYIVKLVNHSVKKSSGSLIYSRRTKNSGI